MDDQSTNNEVPTDLEVSTEGAMTPVVANEQSAKKIFVNDITPPPAQNQEASTTLPQDDGIVVQEPEATEPETAEVTVAENVSDDITEPTSDSAEETSPSETEKVEESVEEVAQPEAETPSQAEEETKDSNPVAPTTPAVSDVAPQEEIIQAAPTPQNDVVMGVAASQLGAKPPHRNNRKFAALITIFIALVLTGIAVYVYMSANNNTKESSSSEATTTEQTEATQEVTPATVDNVDQTITEIEQSVNALDDTTDLSEDDLTDKTLGL